MIKALKFPTTLRACEELLSIESLNENAWKWKISLENFMKN